MNMNIEQKALALANHLLDIESKTVNRGNKKKDEDIEKFKKSTQWLSKRILSTYTASPKAQTRLAKDKNRYKKTIYSIDGVTFKITVLGVFQLMVDNDFIYVSKYHYFKRDLGKGEQTRIKPTQKFLDWFDIDIKTLPQQIVAFEETNPILYQKVTKRKDSKGKPVKVKTLIPYEDTSRIIEMRNNINLINDCLKRHWSDLELPDDKWRDLQKSLLSNKKYDYEPIRLHRQTIRRIFNDKDFTQGGRFYGGWWQNIPSRYRSLITIDGSRIAEFDFGKLHPTMMYADAKATCEGDAYDIGLDPKHRDTIKELFNAMVQMDTFTDNPPKVKFSQTGKRWKKLRDMILERHKPIRHMFFCGIGNSLQYRDSMIAEQVMLYFAKRDIPVLPVHDSFLIQTGLYLELLEVMGKEFKKQIGVPINIKPVQKLTRVRARDDRDIIEHIISEQEVFSDWTARNPL